MRFGRMFGAGAAVLAMVAMANPAEAQRRHHRHYDRVDGGDVLLGAILAGGLIAIASASEKRAREKAEARERARREAEDAEYYARNQPSAPASAPASSYPDITNAESASDACAAAAESTGMKFARIARVGSISSVDPTGSNWLVRGMLELRNDYRSKWEPRGFQCTIAGAGAPTVRIEGYAQ